MSLKLLEGKIRFDRQEFAGSFGDIGTDFPLIVSLILVCNLDVPSVLIMFGLMQIMTGLLYGIPMPVQPLKAMAVIMITQKLSGSVLYAAGLAIGLIMFFLSITGLLTYLAKIVPKPVIRGIQLGLGLQLMLLALQKHIPSQGNVGLFLAAISLVLIIFLRENRRYPAALLVIGLGMLYALATDANMALLSQSVHFHLPKTTFVAREDLIDGLILLALPQISLSLGNSILATSRIVKDFFPQQSLTVKKIGLTYSLMNLVAPFFSGIPVCHGSGGVAGHYAFGARTGGSVIIYGTMYLALGLFLSEGFLEIIKFFPKSVLGVILFFEGWTLVKLIKDIRVSKKDLMVALLVGVIAVGVRYGYVLGLLLGTALAWVMNKGKVEVEK